MTQEEIIKYDKVIDDFMGTKHPRRKYHSSWDWLMPVVGKILYGGINVNDQGEILAIDIQRKLSYAKLEPTYYSVVTFIQWYNTQNKTT